MMLRLIALIVLPGAAHAHTDASDAGADLWIGIPIIVTAVLYGIGVCRLWANAGLGRGLSLVQNISFWSGLGLLAFATLSSLHRASEIYFSLHMIEHEILMVIAAPLLVMARPGAAFGWALPRRALLTWSRAAGTISGVWRRVQQPGAATLIHGIALWTWHAPALFEAALHDETIHRLQHACFFFTALLFWWALFNSRPHRHGISIAMLFITSMHSALLGALLTFSPQLWYANYPSDGLFDLSPLADQQLGGLVMWVPMGLVYAGAALIYGAIWIRSTRQVVHGQV